VLDAGGLAVGDRSQFGSGNAVEQARFRVGEGSAIAVDELPGFLRRVRVHVGKEVDNLFADRGRIIRRHCHAADGLALRISRARHSGTSRAGLPQLTGCRN
jgi:hypothetical protein